MRLYTYQGAASGEKETTVCAISIKQTNDELIIINNYINSSLILSVENLNMMGIVFACGVLYVNM